ncbi:AAWKG family protein [Streptomyces sp. V2I9]|uniref:AAWKG family protein n=1 Tax=Streptomyces sp. V2I9 TaxID=3042304 RepID=UPI0027855748|nr:AAWKG family protein [Streptomyces sp. V2I9]MDQ0988457.1 phage baseplate assembly protein gpV/Skp family chaperone for outer membrane proteins [Streptomyces sp. V2I9]
MAAERFDPESEKNVGKYSGKVARSDADDTWGNLIKLITGYPVPERSKIFEKLTSANGGPLFRMDIKERDLQEVLNKSGFAVEKGQDYDIWFFDKKKNGKGKTQLKQARIVFEGRSVDSSGKTQFANIEGKSANEIEYSKGNDFKDYHKAEMSTIPLAQYMYGPRFALNALASGSTEGMAFSNLGVPPGGVVDLKSFTRAADSFDRAAHFFKLHKETILGWEKKFGGEGAAWKGESAEVFLGLLKKIRENYESYTRTFYASLGKESSSHSQKSEQSNVSTVYAQALAEGRSHLQKAANSLLKIWYDWTQSPYYDPLRVLRYVLDDLARWCEENNIKQTEIYTTTYSGAYSNNYAGSTTFHASEKGGFSQIHPEYGDLAEIKNWAKVGQAAVRIWSQGVDTYLGEPAAQVQSDLNNKFLDLGMVFTQNVPQPKSTKTVAAEFKEAQAEKEKKKLEKEREETKAEQKKEKEEAKTEREKEKEEYKKEKAEAKAERDQEKAEYKKEKEEAERKAEEERKKIEENLGTLNKPSSDFSKSLLNEMPPTVSVGDLGGLNGKSGGGLGGPVTTSLGSLGNLGGGLTDTAGSPAGGGLADKLGDITAGLGGPITTPLGSLGNLNGGLGGAGGLGLTRPTGGQTSLTDGGALGSTFPDGSRTSFDPRTGTLTTTAPDGSTTAKKLGGDASVTNPDGSTTRLGADGDLVTTYPDGTVEKIDPATGEASTTRPDGTTTRTDLGNLEGLNGKRVPIGLETPTGGTTSLAGGDFTTHHPGGGSTSFDPDTGVLTTTAPDGTTTTTDLTHGATRTNPDGSTTSLRNGQLTTEFPDGSKQVIDPDTGIATTTDPQGKVTRTDLGDLGGINSPSSDLADLDNRRVATPTGGSTTMRGGDVDLRYPDGSRASFDPDTGKLTTTGPNGALTTTDLSGGTSHTAPDGSKVTYENGKLTTEFPDGSKQVVDPETGVATTTDPRGNTSRVDLDGLDFPRDPGIPKTIGSDFGSGSPSFDRPSLGNLDLNLGGGARSGGGGQSLGSLDGLGGGSSSTEAPRGVDASGNAVPLSDLPTSGAGTDGAAFAGAGAGAGLGAGAGAGGAGTPGAPMMPPMGGMGGAGGDKGSHNERVRAILTDALEEGKRRNRRRRGPWGRSEDEDTFLAAGKRPATTGGRGADRDAEDPARPSTTTSSAYLEEDEDVWGTEGGSAPAVIGR